VAAVLLSVVVLFLPAAPGTSSFPYADKVVHAALFALLTATALARFGRAPVVGGAVAAYALASEVVQGLALPDRSGDPLDVVADLVGAGAVVLADRLRERRRRD